MHWLIIRESLLQINISCFYSWCILEYVCTSKWEPIGIDPVVVVIQKRYINIVRVYWWHVHLLQIRNNLETKITFFLVSSSMRSDWKLNYVINKMPTNGDALKFTLTSLKRRILQREKYRKGGCRRVNRNWGKFVGTEL